MVRWCGTSGSPPTIICYITTWRSFPTATCSASRGSRSPPRKRNQAGRLAVLTPEAGLWPDMIVEFEPQPPDSARIVWEWHMWDHTIQNHNPDASHYGEPAEHPRLIDVNGGGGRRRSCRRRCSNVFRSSVTCPKRRSRTIWSPTLCT